MPLDFDLIERATDYSTQQLEKLQASDCPYVFLLSQFLYPKLINKFNQYVMEIDNDKWERTGSSHRKKLCWIPDTVYEEVHIVFSNLTKNLEEIFNRKNSFLGINIWKDTEGYQILKHIDMPKLDLSIQLYLNSADTNLATTFDYDNKIIQPEYKKNCGYLMDQRGKIIHYMNNLVPKNYVRYSVYAMWTSN